MSNFGHFFETTPSFDHTHVKTEAILSRFRIFWPRFSKKYPISFSPTCPIILIEITLLAHVWLSGSFSKAFSTNQKLNLRREKYLKINHIHFVTNNNQSQSLELSIWPKFIRRKWKEKIVFTFSERISKTIPSRTPIWRKFSPYRLHTAYENSPRDTRIFLLLTHLATLSKHLKWKSRVSTHLRVISTLMEVRIVYKKTFGDRSCTSEMESELRMEKISQCWHVARRLVTEPVRCKTLRQLKRELNIKIRFLFFFFRRKWEYF